MVSQRTTTTISTNHGSRELVYRMALLTLEVVRLGMTGCHHACSIRSMATTTVGGLPLINSLVVTGTTFRDPVSTAQREARKVMIKPSLLPEVLRVTVLTRQQLSIMRIILMMTLATFLTGAMQNTLVHMTFLAIQLQMHTIQQEVLVVLGSILPAAFIVTLGAKRTIRALMHILVTSLTIPLRQFRE